MLSHPLVRTLVPLLLSAGIAAAAPRVDNPAEPADGSATLQLAELWRIGGPEDEETLLGVVNDVAVDAEGFLYLLDIQLLEVQVYGPGGDHLRTVGHAGDGPGEFRRASRLIFMPDGTLGVVQQFPGRIIQLETDGLPAGEIRLGGDDPAAGGFQMLQGAALGGGRLMVSGARMSREESRRTAVHFIAPLDPATGPGAPLLEKTTVRDFGNSRISEADEYFPHAGGWTVGPDGRTHVAPHRNQYEIYTYSPTGDLERSLTRPYASRDRTAQEVAERRESMIPRRRRNRGGLDVVVERTVRDILQMRVDDAGNLWVLPSRGIKDQPAGIHSTWDVFDPQGVYRRRVSVACEGSGDRDVLFFAEGGLIVLVREHAGALKAFRGQGGETDGEDIDARPLEVVVYRSVE